VPAAGALSSRSRHAIPPDRPFGNAVGTLTLALSLRERGKGLVLAHREKAKESVLSHRERGKELVIPGGSGENG
jgi:hypothetical protein